MSEHIYVKICKQQDGLLSYRRLTWVIIGGILKQMIESGDLPTGTRLENESSLAAHFGLSRQTMRRAIGYLVDRGLLIRKRGVGTEVGDAMVRRQVELTSLFDDLARPGETRARRSSAFRSRQLHADTEPLALMHNYVPVSLLRLSAADLEAQGSTTCSALTHQPLGRQAVNWRARLHRRRGARAH